MFKFNVIGQESFYIKLFPCFFIFYWVSPHNNSFFVTMTSIQLVITHTYNMYHKKFMLNLLRRKLLGYDPSWLKFEPKLEHHACYLELGRAQIYRAQAEPELFKSSPSRARAFKKRCSSLTEPKLKHYWIYIWAFYKLPCGKNESNLQSLSN